MDNLKLSSLAPDVLQLTICRPEACNAFNFQMWLDLKKILQEAENQARVLVITGGTDFFASGADLKELKAIKNEADARITWQAIYEALDYLYQLNIPTLAAISGPCLGGGLLLASACDLRYCSQTATFGLPIAKLGICLDQAILERLVALIGPAKLKELVFTGQTIGAEEALKLGLVNDLYSLTDFDEQVKAKALAIAQQSFASIQFTRNCLSGKMSGDFSQSPAINSYLSQDFHNRLAGFLKENL
jgi:enoyl-CoA hydratase/carnithine racemase